MGHSLFHSIRQAIGRLFLRDLTPRCASCGRKMTVAQIDPLLTLRVDVVTFTCRKCGTGEKRALRRPQGRR